MTGGTARMVSRSATPASHSSSSARSVASCAVARRGTQATATIEANANAAIR